MTLALREVQRSLRASPIFTLYVLATLIVAGTIGLITYDVIDLGMTHFDEASHRTHDVTYGLLFTTLVIGVVAQLRRPERNVAAMVMALFPPATLLLAGVLSGRVDMMHRNPLRFAAWVAVVAALVHPTGRGFFRSFSIARVSRVMLALVGLVAVPLIAFASTNIGLQRTVTDSHGSMGHFGFMAAFAFTVIAVGVLASLRADGWRVPAWVTALLPAVLGLTSILFPYAASSLDLWWALAAITWGLVFLVSAELTKPEDGRDRQGAPDARAAARL